MSRKIISFTEKKDKTKQNNSENDELYKKDKQIFMINNLYLNEEFTGKKVVKRELTKKLSSYKLQDEKKQRYSKDQFINSDQLLEKLVVSKLVCYYCKNNMLVMYKNKREPSQWTLDRIDNKLGHSSENCVVSCLKCNLEKRTRDDEKFKFTKQMNIIKQY